MRRLPKWINAAGERVALPPPVAGPRILYYDIETAPQLHYAWGAGKWDTRPLKVVKPRYLLSVTYNWEGSDDFHFVGLNQNPNFKPDRPWSKPKTGVDRWVLGALWWLFSSADITIAHNGDRFDSKRTQARFIVNDVQPPNPPKTIDTLKEYRRYANFSSNRLADLGEELGLGTKYHHPGIDMWWGCMEGDPEMWAEMETYNIRDVELLKNVYHRILPWIGSPNKSNPGVNAASFATADRPIACPKPGCGNDKLIARGVVVRNSGLRYMRWQCVGKGGCGGYSQSRYAERDEYRPLVK